MKTYSKSVCIILFMILNQTNISAQNFKFSYIGIGYNLSYAPLRKVNQFIDLYNAKPIKDGGYTIDVPMNHLTTLDGINFTAGFQLGDGIIDVSWTRREGKVAAIYEIPNHSERHIRYKSGTLSFGLLIPLINEGDFRAYGGMSLEFISGSLQTYITYGTQKKEWRDLNSFGNFGLQPALQFFYRPVEFLPIDLGLRVYYQANIARNDMSGLETEMYNHWNEDKTKLKATGGNLGIVFQALLSIPSLKNRTPREKKIKPIKMPDVQTVESKNPLIITLSGAVSDARNGKMIDAVVHFTNEKGLTESVLAKDGKYSVRLNNNSTYQVVVESFGYQSLSSNITLNNVKTEKMTQNFELNMLKTGEAITLKNIYFERASAVLLDESIPELEKIVSFMKNNPQIAIELSGYTSSEGKDDYNLQLSKDRANSIKSWIVKHGINESRINAKGYGKENPVSDNDTEEGRKLNRRVEFKIVKSE